MGRYEYRLLTLHSSASAYGINKKEKLTTNLYKKYIYLYTEL